MWRLAFHKRILFNIFYSFSGFEDKNRHSSPFRFATDRISIWKCYLRSYPIFFSSFPEANLCLRVNQNKLFKFFIRFRLFIDRHIIHFEYSAYFDFVYPSTYLFKNRYEFCEREFKLCDELKRKIYIYVLYKRKNGWVVRFRLFYFVIKDRSEDDRRYTSASTTTATPISRLLTAPRVP